MGTHSCTQEKRNQIVADYCSGLSYKQCAKKHNIGKGVVERAVTEAGVARNTSAPKLDWRAHTDRIVSLYLGGHGIKAIARIIYGQPTSPATVIEVLRGAGIYGTVKNKKGSETWAGYSDAEIDSHARLEREHCTAWVKAFPRGEPAASPEEKQRLTRQRQLEKYYANHEERKARAAAYARKKYHATRHDPEAITKRFMRMAVARVSRVYGMKKTQRTLWYFGCTHQFLRSYLEQRFKPGMTWENRGSAWEIDHIIPLSSFDLTSKSDQRRCNHYTNLRPLWKAENRAKSDRTDEQLDLLPAA